MKVGPADYHGVIRIEGGQLIAEENQDYVGVYYRGFNATMNRVP